MGAVEFQAHVAGGVSTVCRCWAVTRRDGLVLGFTDHDRELVFEGIRFAPDSGMSARALEQSTGLAVDNTEALGVLTGAAVTEADIQAGRYDGAGVRAWLVNWADPDARTLIFKGTIGEIERSAGAFRAELRGLADALNQPQGRVYQSTCAAILGSADCGVDLDQAGFATAVPVETVTDNRVFAFSALAGFAERWFERGQVVVQTGAAAGLKAVVKNDRSGPDGRVIELWEALPAAVLPGDTVRIEAGCDRRAETCRLKFANMANFRGFPHLPGDDWLAAVPRRSGINDGGSMSS